MVDTYIKKTTKKLIKQKFKHKIVNNCFSLQIQVYKIEDKKKTKKNKNKIKRNIFQKSSKQTKNKSQKK